MKTKNSNQRSRIKFTTLLISSILSTLFASFLLENSGLWMVLVFFITIAFPLVLIILPIWWYLILANKSGVSWPAFLLYCLFSGPLLLSALMIIHASGGNRVQGYFVAKYLEWRPTPDYVAERNIPDFVKEHDHLTIIGKPSGSTNYFKLVPALLLNTPLKKVTLQANEFNKSNRQTYWIEIGEACNLAANGNVKIRSLQSYGYDNKCIFSKSGGPAETTLVISSRRNQQKIVYDRTVFEDVISGVIRQSAKWEKWHSKYSRPRKILGQETDVISAIEMIYGVSYETKAKLNPKVLELSRAEVLQKMKEFNLSKLSASSDIFHQFVFTNWDKLSSQYSFTVEEKADLAARIYLTSMCKEARYFRSKKYLPMIELENSKQANAFFKNVLETSGQPNIVNTCSARPEYPGKDWPYKKFDYKMSEEALNQIRSILNSQSSEWQKSIALSLLSRAEDLGQGDAVQNILIDSITSNELSTDLKLTNFDKFITQRNISVSPELLGHLTKITSDLTDNEFGERVDNIGFIIRRVNRNCKNSKTTSPLNLAFMYRYKNYVLGSKYNHSTGFHNRVLKNYSRMEQRLKSAMERCTRKLP